jgi:hypothetical protein
MVFNNSSLFMSMSNLISIDMHFRNLKPKFVYLLMQKKKKPPKKKLMVPIDNLKND